MKVTGCCNITHNGIDILWDDKFYIFDDNTYVSNNPRIKNAIGVQIRGDIKSNPILYKNGYGRYISPSNTTIESAPQPYWGTSYATQVTDPPIESDKYGKNNVIEGVTCKNFRTSLKMIWSSDSVIRYCNIKNGTTTNISCVQCGDNMEICYNIGRNGGDDIFAISAQPARSYTNLRIHHNYFENTHGSCIAYSGYSNVKIYNNYLRNSSSGLIKAWVYNYQFVQGHEINDNYLVDGGRAWNPNFPILKDPVDPTKTLKNFTVPWDGSEACAIRMYYYNNLPVQDNLFYENINIHDNYIINPQTVGIVIMKAKNIIINNNKYYKGISTKYGYNNGILYENISTEKIINIYSQPLQNISDIIHNYVNLTYNGSVISDSPNQSVTVNGITYPYFIYTNDPSTYYIGKKNTDGTYGYIKVDTVKGTAGGNISDSGHYIVKDNSTTAAYKAQSFVNKNYINGYTIPVVYDVKYDTVYPSVFINPSVVKWWVKDGYNLVDLKNNIYQKVSIYGQLIDAIDIYYDNYNIIGIHWIGVQSGIIYTDEYSNYLTGKYETINIRNIPDKYLTFTSNQFLSNLLPFDPIILNTTDISTYKNKFNLMIGRKNNNKVIEGYRWTTTGNKLVSSGFYTDDGNINLNREIPITINIKNPTNTNNIRINFYNSSYNLVSTFDFNVSLYYKGYINNNLYTLLNSKFNINGIQYMAFGSIPNNPSTLYFKSYPLISITELVSKTDKIFEDFYLYATFEYYKFVDLTNDKSILPKLGIPFINGNESGFYNIAASYTEFSVISTNPSYNQTYITTLTGDISYPNQLVTSNELTSSAYENLIYISTNATFTSIADIPPVKFKVINKSRIFRIKMSSNLDLTKAVINIERIGENKYNLKILNKGDIGYNFTLVKSLPVKTYVAYIEVPAKRSVLNNVLSFNTDLNKDITSASYYISFTFDKVDDYIINNIKAETYLNNNYITSFGTIISI
jgi:hypothetical protein